MIPEDGIKERGKESFGIHEVRAATRALQLEKQREGKKTTPVRKTV